MFILPKVNKLNRVLLIKTKNKNFKDKKSSFIIKKCKSCLLYLNN